MKKSLIKKILFIVLPLAVAAFWLFNKFKKNQQQALIENNAGSALTDVPLTSSPVIIV